MLADVRESQCLHVLKSRKYKIISTYDAITRAADVYVIGLFWTSLPPGHLGSCVSGSRRGSLGDILLVIAPGKIYRTTRFLHAPIACKSSAEHPMLAFFLSNALSN
jgi:hypothetical protein